MVVNAYIFETRGGRMVTEFEPLDVKWNAATNAAEDVTVTIDLRNAVEAARDWRSLATPWKHSIAIDTGTRVLGGPILPSTMTDDDGKLQIVARGVVVLFDRFPILPVAVLTRPEDQRLTLPNGLPDPAVDTTLSGLDYGTIGKRLIQQALAWPGGADLPIVFQDDRTGSREKTYPAVDMKKVGDALVDLSKLENGCDFRFQLRWRDDTRLEWFFETGTEQTPRLQSPDISAWEVGDGSGLKVETNPSRMASIVWSIAGRSSDIVLARMRYESALIDHGFPLLFTDSGVSPTASDPTTLDSRNVEALRTAAKPWEFWSFSISAADAGAFNVREGDYLDVIVTADANVSGGFVAAGTYRRRVAALSGTLGDWVTITCGEVYDG